MKFSSIKKQQQKHQHYEQQLYDTQHPNWPPKITTSEATLNHPFWAQRDHWIEQVQQHTSRSLGRVRDQMPPQIPPTSHIHEGPEPRHYQSANLGSGVGGSIGGVWDFGVGWDNYRVTVVFGGRRLRSEVPEDEETGEGCGQEYENESERTHFALWRRKKNAIEDRARVWCTLLDPRNKVD